MGISAKQQKVLDYIRSFMKEHGYPPAVRDICQGLNLKSTSTAHGYLARLESRDIYEEILKTRAIELIENDAAELRSPRRDTGGQCASIGPGSCWYAYFGRGKF